MKISIKVTTKLLSSRGTKDLYTEEQRQRRNFMYIKMTTLLIVKSIPLRIDYCHFLSIIF